MFEDYYLNNPELQGLLAAAGYPVSEEPSQPLPTVQPTTQEAEAPATNAPLTLAQLAARVAPGRDPSQREQIIASQNLVPTPFSINNYLEFGNGQGVAGGTPATTGLYAGHNYTLVDNKTGTILAQGSTPEEIQKIQDIANNLNATQGKNADWRLYDANPESGITNMHEKMPGAYLDLSTPGDPRGVVVAGNMPNNVFKDFIIPALTPIALAAGAYFGGGALLGQAAGGGAAGAGAAGAGAATGTGAAATGAGLGTAATATGAGAGLGAAASGVAPIVVTGATGLTAAQTAALATGLAGAGAAGTGAGAGGSASAVNPYDPIVVTGGATTPGTIPAVAGGVMAGLPALSNPPTGPSLTQPETLPEDIVVNAPQSVLPPPPILGVETALPAITSGALTPAQTAGPQPSTNGGVLGTGLNIPQLISIGGVGADLLKNLLAGGDGTGTGTPYVSQFGPGLGLGTGQDMRANPNIIDYEKYGFGPEAMFFQPGYGLLNSAAPAPAPAPQAQPIMATNPRYEPLI